MATKDIYKLKGKTSEQVQIAYVAFMGDKDATTKQIKDAENSNYAKIGTRQIVSDIVQKLYSKDCIFDLRASESVQNVSDELSTMIEDAANNPKEQKELKNVRSYINKYKEFLTYCEQLADMVHREYIHFQLTPFGMMFKRAGEVLPVMETDVSLYNPQTGEKKILDAKYYKETLVSKYGAKEKVRREHLSQIISYVMNQEDSGNPHTFGTSGTLVYPTIDEDFNFSYRYKNTNHMIHVTTVNLNQDWEKIETRIKEIVGKR